MLDFGLTLLAEKATPDPEGETATRQRLPSPVRVSALRQRDRDLVTWGGKLRTTMTDLPAEEDPVPPDLDENGVDLAQIRDMLDLPPAERLRAIENLADSVAQIRKLNGPRPIR